MGNEIAPTDNVVIIKGIAHIDLQYPFDKGLTRIDRVIACEVVKHSALTLDESEDTPSGLDAGNYQPETLYHVTTKHRRLFAAGRLFGWVTMRSEVWEHDFIAVKRYLEEHGAITEGNFTHYPATAG